mmetsp:Transcript_24174/g.59170  ORF Transcript_24174/g.59170 Transcript_24174/m.59170 type:complete len:350 (+) Transcript_24174:1117-2166(+)
MIVSSIRALFGFRLFWLVFIQGLLLLLLLNMLLANGRKVVVVIRTGSSGSARFGCSYSVLFVESLDFGFLFVVRATTQLSGIWRQSRIVVVAGVGGVILFANGFCLDWYSSDHRFWRWRWWIQPSPSRLWMFLLIFWFGLVFLVCRTIILAKFKINVFRYPSPSPLHEFISFLFFVILLFPLLLWRTLVVVSIITFFVLVVVLVIFIHLFHCSPFPRPCIWTFQWRLLFGGFHIVIVLLSILLLLIGICGCWCRYSSQHVRGKDHGFLCHFLFFFRGNGWLQGCQHFGGYQIHFSGIKNFIGKRTARLTSSSSMNTIIIIVFGQLMKQIIVIVTAFEQCLIVNIINIII